MTSELLNKRDIDRGDGWEIQEIINKKSGFSRYTKYFYQGKRAPRVEIRTKLASQLAGYSLIEKDLRNVLVWLDEAEKIFPFEDAPKQNLISPDRSKFNIVKGLFVASLVFYGKCFTQCEGRKIKLDKKFIDQKYHEVHDSIMNARHNFAAHSGADKFEEVKVALVLPPNKKSKMAPILYKELMQADFMIDDKDIGFRDLIKHIQNKVLDKMEILESKIMEDEVLPKGKLYWYKRAKKIIIS